MHAKLKNVPKTWPKGATRTVTVAIEDGVARARCTVTLHRTTPAPERLLGSREVNLDDNGVERVGFPITLGVAGITVLHCEVRSKTDVDSDSKGTVVE